DQCALKLVLEKRLAQILQGEKANPEDLLALAEHCCRYKNRYREAVRLYAAAFAARPNLAADLKGGHRYNAAGAAAQAAAEQAVGAGGLDSREKAQLRKQAQEW